ncbi:hypothetical protein RJ639_022383 [Escallonia herrerae]|uniref:RNase H type-1 domain-containing protein n=1 Tax=Escallonia herrerae TaxID=1293975 RepID=A0AA88V648_9ASTE|nr:hypothetical protein RJ639_022383 [Escallonia herrerae]
MLYVDGSSNASESRIRLILRGSDGLAIECALRFDFPASNNEAEYEALIVVMHLARVIRPESLHAYSDPSSLSSYYRRIQSTRLQDSRISQQGKDLVKDFTNGKMYMIMAITYHDILGKQYNKQRAQIEQHHKSPSAIQFPRYQGNKQEPKVIARVGKSSNRVDDT